MSANESQVSRSMPTLLAALRSKDAGMRKEAVESLGRLGKENIQAVDALFDALRDTDEAVRTAAANALAKMWPISESATARLLVDLHDVRAGVRQAAKVVVDEASAREKRRRIIRDGSESDLYSAEDILILGEIESPQVLGFTAYYLGTALVEQGHWYDGLDLLKQSLAIRREMDDLIGHASTLYQIARAHHLMGNLDKARISYRDAQRLYEHLADQRGIAACKVGLGHLMTQMGFIDDAVDELETALAVYHKLDDEERVKGVEAMLQIANRLREKQLA